MTGRGLDLDFEDATRDAGGNLIHFVEFGVIPATSSFLDPNSATITRTQDGLNGWADFANGVMHDGTTITDTGDFDTSLVSVALTPGVGIVITPAIGLGCFLGSTHYNFPGIPEMAGMYIQGSVIRDNEPGNSLMPGFGIAGGSTLIGASYVHRRVRGIGSIWPNTENQDSISDIGDIDFSAWPTEQPICLDYNRRNPSGYSYPDASILDLGRLNIGSGSGIPFVLLRGWRRPDGGGPCCPCDPNPPLCCCGIPSICPDCPPCQVGYDGPVTWKGVAAMDSDTVCVLNMPKGYQTHITGKPNIFPAMEDVPVRAASLGATVDEFGGGGVYTTTSDGDSAFIYANGYTYPYQTLVLTPIVGQAVPGAPTLTLTPPDGIWGGDCYTLTYQQQPPTINPIVGLVTSDMDLTWDGKDWAGCGRESLAFGQMRESSDLKAQGVRFQLPVIDSAAALDAIKSNDNYRGGVVRVWAAKYDEALGELLSEPQLIFHGYAQDGFDVVESPPVDNPGTAIIEARIGSRLAVLQRRVGILANMHSHQQIHAGDTFFNGREQLIGFEVPWNSDGKNAPVPQQPN